MHAITRVPPCKAVDYTSHNWRSFLNNTVQAVGSRQPISSNSRSRSTPGMQLTSTRAVRCAGHMQPASDVSSEQAPPPPCHFVPPPPHSGAPTHMSRAAAEQKWQQAYRTLTYMAGDVATDRAGDTATVTSKRAAHIVVDGGSIGGIAPNHLNMALPATKLLYHAKAARMMPHLPPGCPIHYKNWCMNTCK